MAQLTDEQIEVWILMMQDVSFAAGMNRMKAHIRTNKYPPTIAEVVSADLSPDHERLRAETEDRFAEMEANDQLAIDCPVHLIPRFLKSGVSD